MAVDPLYELLQQTATASDTWTGHCNKLEQHISPSSLVTLFFSTLHCSNSLTAKVRSFFRVLWQKPLQILSIDVGETNRFDPVTFLPAFSFRLLRRLLEVFFIKITLTASPLGAPRIYQTQWFQTHRDSLCLSYPAVSSLLRNRMGPVTMPTLYEQNSSLRPFATWLIIELQTI